MLNMETNVKVRKTSMKRKWRHEKQEHKEEYYMREEKQG